MRLNHPTTISTEITNNSNNIDFMFTVQLLNAIAKANKTTGSADASTENIPIFVPETRRNIITCNARRLVPMVFDVFQHLERVQSTIEHSPDRIDLAMLKSSSVFFFVSFRKISCLPVYQ